MKGDQNLYKLSSLQRKIAMTLIWLSGALLAYSALLGFILGKTPIVRLDERAEIYVENTMARAAYTFAIVRGLNGMISVIQGTEVALSPAGIGLNLSVGEVLDPINDLAERFSWVMLVSTASLGIQRILMEMSDWLGLQVLMTTGMLLLAVSVWKRFWGRVDLHSTGIGLVMLAVVIRMMIPAVALVSETIYARFLSDHYQEASQTLTHIREELSQVDPTGPVNGATASSANRLQEIRRWLAETSDWSDMRKKIDQLGAKLERFTADAVHLMVVFILQTILIPLLTLWLLTKSLTLRHALPGPKEPSED